MHNQYALYVLMAVFVILAILDVYTTNLFLKTGTGHESNPVEIEIQSVFGKWWWVAKLALTVPLLAVVYFLGSPLGIVAVFALILYYASAVYNNWLITKGEAN